MLQISERSLQDAWKHNGEGESCGQQIENTLESDQ